MWSKAKALKDEDYRADVDERVDTAVGVREVDKPRARDRK